MLNPWDKELTIFIHLQNQDNPHFAKWLLGMIQLSTTLPLSSNSLLIKSTTKRKPFGHCPYSFILSSMKKRN